MKKVIFACIALCLSISLSACANETHVDKDKLIVTTSFYPMYDFAKKIGEDKIDVVNVIPAGSEPHDWEPSTNDIIRLEKSDVLLLNGAGLEHWSEQTVASLDNKDLLVVDTSKKLTLLNGEEHDHHEDEHEDHDHGMQDPHTWLNPQNAKLQMEAIKNAFVEKDPKNKEVYEKNYEEYAKQFDELDAAYKEMIQKSSKKELVVSHQAFAYLCDAYGLIQYPVEGLTPDSEPDAKRMVEIIDVVKELDVTYIFFEAKASSKVADVIAKETGAKVGVLYTLESLSQKQLDNKEDYFSLMYKNLDAIKEALQ